MSEADRDIILVLNETIRDYESDMVDTCRSEHECRGGRGELGREKSVQVLGEIFVVTTMPLDPDVRLEKQILRGEDRQELPKTTMVEVPPENTK